MLLAGILYALTSIGAETSYRNGYWTGPAIEAVALLRQSGDRFPFDHRFRTASALRFGRVALQIDSQPWRDGARAEIGAALIHDPASAELWELLVKIEIASGLEPFAIAHYRQFKRVAGASPFNPFGN